jgi:hypothetical protein
MKKISFLEKFVKESIKMSFAGSENKFVDEKIKK